MDSGQAHLLTAPDRPKIVSDTAGMVLNNGERGTLSLIPNWRLTGFNDAVFQSGDKNVVHVIPLDPIGAPHGAAQPAQNQLLSNGTVETTTPSNHTSLGHSSEPESLKAHVDIAPIGLAVKRELLADHDANESITGPELSLINNATKTIGDISSIYSISSDEDGNNAPTTVDTKSPVVGAITPKTSVSSNVPGAFCQDLLGGKGEAGSFKEPIGQKLNTADLPESISDMLRTQNSLLQKFMENRKHGVPVLFYNYHWLTYLILLQFLFSGSSPCQTTNHTTRHML